MRETKLRWTLAVAVMTVLSACSAEVHDPADEGSELADPVLPYEIQAASSSAPGGDECSCYADEEILSSSSTTQLPGWGCNTCEPMIGYPNMPGLTCMTACTEMGYSASACQTWCRFFQRASCDGLYKLCLRIPNGIYARQCMLLYLDLCAGRG